MANTCLWCTILYLHFLPSVDGEAFDLVAIKTDSVRISQKESNITLNNIRALIANELGTVASIHALWSVGWRVGVTFHDMQGPITLKLKFSTDVQGHSQDFDWEGSSN